MVNGNWYDTETKQRRTTVKRYRGVVGLLIYRLPCSRLSTAVCTASWEGEWEEHVMIFCVLQCQFLDTCPAFPFPSLPSTLTSLALSLLLSFDYHSIRHLLGSQRTSVRHDTFAWSFMMHVSHMGRGKGGMIIEFKGCYCSDLM